MKPSNVKPKRCYEDDDRCNDCPIDYPQKGCDTFDQIKSLEQQVVKLEGEREELLEFIADIHKAFTPELGGHSEIAKQFLKKYGRL